MSISLSRLDPNGADRPGLIDFFTSNDFPFHVRPEQWTVAKVEELIESGAFRSDDTESFWLRHEELGILGLVRLEDLTEDTPMFDLRLVTEFRGRGLVEGSTLPTSLARIGSDAQRLSRLCHSARGMEV